MLLRERQTPEGLLVSVCDEACLGETFVDDPINLDVTEEFYGGEEAIDADDEAVIDGLTRADVANIVGEQAVSVAIEAGLVDRERVLEIEGTLHAQLLWL